jgi:starch synthase
MADSLNILWAAAECAPLAKVGGLGDVVGELPRFLRALGHDVRVAIPYHGVIDAARFRPEFVREYAIPSRGGAVPVTVHQTEHNGVPIYLIGGPLMIENSNIYGNWGDAGKYACFSVAAGWLPLALGWQIDVLHAHDWHAAAAVGWMGQHGWRLPFYQRTATVYTFHNLPYTGAGAGDALYHFNLWGSPAEWLPEWLRWSPMALGISMADIVSTVSPGYAGETLTREGGRGLESLLLARMDSYVGILNGIDTTLWNPAADAHLKVNYDADTLEKRAENKRVLQEDSRLPVRDDVPVLGVVSRMEPQKGTAVLLGALPALLQDDVQVVILGAGSQHYFQEMLVRLAYRYPEKITLRFEFNLEAAARIYAGADLFLMPSLYEPCGLGQLIALRYGAVPLVRATGGLRDTVQNYNEAADTGTGFAFDDFTAPALYHTTQWALRIFQDKARWQALQKRGMAQDFSWDASAHKYEQMYGQATQRHAEYLHL